MTDTDYPTPAETVPGTDDAGQDAPVTGPEGNADDSEPEVPQIDVDAMLETVKGKDEISFGVLSMAANARKTYQEVAKKLADAASGKDNFESLLAKHSDDERIAQVNNAIQAITQKMNDAIQAGRLRLTELGVTTTAVSETEKAALKEERAAARKTLNDAIALFEQFAENAKGAAQFLPIVDALRLPKAKTAAKTGTSGGDERLSAIRAWANANGMKVAERGRIAASVVEAWEKAGSPMPEKAEKTAEPEVNTAA
jgi:Lsr2.